MLKDLPHLETIRAAWRHVRTQWGRRPKQLLLWGGILLGGFLVLLWTLTGSRPPMPPATLAMVPAVGAEMKETVILDRPDYQAVKPTASTPLLLRIRSVEPVENGFRYDLLYTGVEAGVFNLTDFLLNPLGGRLRDPVATVTIHSNISADAPFSVVTKAVPFPSPPFPYRMVMQVVGLAWLGWGVRLVFPKKESPRPALSAAGNETVQAGDEPESETLSSLLRPLVEKAADKSITSSEKGRLEQILFLYWGKQMELDHLDSAEQLRRILEHPEAGLLLRTVEQWLYQPGSLITAEEINAALTAYEARYSADLPPPRPVPPPPAEPRGAALDNLNAA